MSRPEQTFSVDQAFRSMSPFFREQSQIELLGSVTAITWLLGGLFNDKYLYSLSMIISIVSLVLTLIHDFLRNQFSVTMLHTYSFRRLIVAVIANWAYTSGQEGPSEFTLFGNEVKINSFIEILIIVLLIIWFASRYSESIDKTDAGILVVPMVVLRGSLRGAILAAVIFALISNDQIPEGAEMPLIVIYLIEPFVYAIYSNLNKTVSTAEMVVGSARLPAVAFRESILSNLLLLIITMIFNGVSGDEWELLRVLYILGTVFAIFSSIDAIKKFNENPFGNTEIGNFLNNTPDVFQDLQINEKLGHVVDSQTIIDVGKTSSIELSPGSIIVPLEETKGKVTTMIIGKSENIVKKNKEKISQTVDGITTAIIPAKNLKNIRQNFTAKQLNTIDLAQYGLPNLQTIESVIKSLGFNMQNWIGNIKHQLTKFKLSNYGITETEDGKTSVCLPGISVIESPGSSIVKVAGVRVYETPEVNTVRIGNFLTVVEFPKMQLVSLPGITIMEMKGVGTAVDLFGFKISDKLSAERLDEFKKVFLAQLNTWEAGVESQLGRIIADPNASAVMSMSWDGDFKPFLEGKKKSFGDHPALGLAAAESRTLLQGSVERTENEAKLIELTGMDSTLKAKKSVKKKKKVQYGNQLNQKRKKQIRKGEPETEALDEIKSSLEKAKMDIDKKLKQVNKEIDGKQKDEYDFEIVEDADYEIIEDDE